jgi:hypothetical protein
MSGAQFEEGGGALSQRPPALPPLPPAAAPSGVEGGECSPQAGTAHSQHHSPHPS